VGSLVIVLLQIFSWFWQWNSLKIGQHLTKWSIKSVPVFWATLYKFLTWWLLNVAGRQHGLCRYNSGRRPDNSDIGSAQVQHRRRVRVRREKDSGSDTRLHLRAETNRCDRRLSACTVVVVTYSAMTDCFVSIFCSRLPVSCSTYVPTVIVVIRIFHNNNNSNSNDCNSVPYWRVYEHSFWHTLQPISSTAFFSAS